MLLQERIDLYTGPADVVQTAELLGEPISPELMLVSPPDVTRLVRQWLPEPEPLDEWVARMRCEELESEWRALLDKVRKREPSRVGGVVFAVGAAIVSVLPILAFLFGV